MTGSPPARPVPRTGASPALHVEVAGAERTVLAPVVLVHGVLDSARTFSRIRRILGERHLTVAYDRRGYQRSREAGAGTGDLADHVVDLLEVATSVAGATGSAPVTVLGHSFGAVVAIAAAGCRPDLLARVVAYEPPLPWLAPDEPAGTEPAGTRTVTPAARETPEAFAERLARSLLGDSRYERLSAGVRAGLALDGPAARAEVSELARGPAFDASLVSAEVVVARGGDTAPRFVRAASYLVEHLPHARLCVLPGAGHGAHVTHPRELAAVVDPDVAAGVGLPPP
ncbi:MAG: alpha/beta fold hydrolase [Actinomycetota bacterium]|nr:alpha/beta fold hydrolase [Actinomycetota bacterium]